MSPNVYRHCQRPPTLTDAAPFLATVLSHNPKSPQSLVALSLLRKAQSGQQVTDQPATSTKKATEAIQGEDVEPINPQTLPPGEQFLADAAADSSRALELSLEVKERSKEPPTQAQIQTILDYLKGAASLALNAPPTSGGARAGSQRDDQHPGATGLSAGNPLPTPGKSVTRAKQTHAQTQTQTQAQHPPAWAEVDPSSIVDQLKNSDLLLVDWENGRAATNLQGVKALLSLLREEQEDPSKAPSSQSQSGGPGCTVM